MNIVDVLKEIILDFQAQVPDTGVPRRLRIHPVPGKAAVCLGVRRGGKSTLLFQISFDQVAQSCMSLSVPIFKATCAPR